MRAGGESKYQQARFGVTEAGHGAGPVGLIEIGPTAGLTDSAAVVAEAGAELAGDDGLVNLLELGRGSQDRRRQGRRIRHLTL